MDVYYPEVDTLVMVLDHLNTHTLGALYATFPPAEARRLVANQELHYTPKHRSWRNMAESDLSLLPRQCLN